MKKIDKSISREYLPVKLNIDNLETIESILVDSEDLEIEAEGFQFDSVQELISKFGDRSLCAMHIRTNRPYVTIELTRMWAKLYVASSSNTNAGLFYKLDCVFRQARRRLWPLYSYYFIWILNLIIITPTYFLPPQGVGVMTYTVLSSACLAWVIWMLYVRLRHHSTIVLVRSTSASFWARKKDELIIALVSAVLGAILGSAVTTLLPHIVKLIK